MFIKSPGKFLAEIYMFLILKQMLRAWEYDAAEEHLDASIYFVILSQQLFIFSAELFFSVMSFFFFFILQEV